MIDLQSMAIIAAALGAGALVKGATGMGLPLVALPALAATFGVAHSLAIMCVPLVVTNAWQVWRYRQARAGGDMAFLTPMLVMGAIGVAAGTWLLTTISEDAMALGLAALVLAYVALRLFSPSFRLTTVTGRRAAPFVGLAAGTLQGSTGLSAPVGVTFIHAMRFDREAHVFAVSTMFLLFALAQTGALAAAGILTGPRFLEGVFALLPVVVLMPLGQKLAALLSREAFDRIILAMLCVMAAFIIFGALDGRG